MDRYGKLLLFMTKWRIMPVLLIVSMVASACISDPTPTPTPVVSDSINLEPPRQLFSLCWVAYTPTNYNPDANPRVDPSEDSIQQDLAVLQKAGFTGLVTYGASGALANVPRVAQEMNFQGLIMGVWDPKDQNERNQAIAVKDNPVVVGYVIGNEGLGSRYSIEELRSSMNALRQATGKPVATTEQLNDYGDSALLNLGDWVFPNVHPFYQGLTDPQEAVQWTKQAYDDLRRRSGRAVLLKEVGLPSGGDSRGLLTATSQAEYYRQLNGTGVKFVYFESFDQSWKQGSMVEHFWGLFHSDRTPKQVTQYLCAAPSPAPAATATAGGAPEPTIPPGSAITPTSPPILANSPTTGSITTDTPTLISSPTSTAASSTSPAATASTGSIFNVYTNADAPDNHFVSSGYMGDTGDITLNTVWKDNPHSFSTAIKVTYEARGRAPACGAPICKWAGVYWQNPQNNWGTIPDSGFNLSGFRKLTFWARSDTEAHVEFSVGGITGKYGDSLQPARTSGTMALTSDWQQFEIDLMNVDLSYMIGGFAWAANWDNNGITQESPKTLVFYLDDIRFER